MPDFPGSIPYKVLKQTHDDYDGDLLEKLGDLYKGGFLLLDKARKYLPKVANESDVRYAERCKISSYKPYFGQIVDQIAADVFTQPLSVKPAADAADPKTPGKVPDEPFYAELEKDVDQEGTPLVALLSDVLRASLVSRWGILAVDLPDAPPDGATPISLADEDSAGQRRAYGFQVPTPELINWKCDKGGKRFQWAVLRRREQLQDDPFDTRGTVTETFTVWRKGDSVAQWARYVAEYDPDKQPDENDLISLQVTGASSFADIPLLRLEMPEGLWAGNKLGPMALEHWQRRSSLISAQNRSLFAIPCSKLGPQAPAKGGPIPADVTQDQDRGRDPALRFASDGFIHLGNEDSIEFVEPDGKCYEITDKQLDALRDDMFHVEHMMAASIRPTGSALGRSGLSKQKDQDSSARVLRAVGSLVRQFAKRIYDTISTARKEDVHWQSHGLDGYESEDREQVIQEAVTLQQVAIPSETFRKEHARMIAERVLKGIDPSTMETIIDEIEKGVAKEFEVKNLELDQKKQNILNPPPPPPPIPGVPPAPGAPPQAPQPPKAAATQKPPDKKAA